MWWFNKYLMIDLLGVSEYPAENKALSTNDSMAQSPIFAQAESLLAFSFMTLMASIQDGRGAAMAANHFALLN